jgi:ABC-2 type transport system permease protein
MLAIYRKEIQSFLDTPVAYMAIGVFLVGMGLFQWVLPETSVLDYGFADMATTFNMAPYMYLVLIPAITMRSIAEERRNGTLELLLTRPLTTTAIIGGKFLAALTLVALSLLPTLVYYTSVYNLGLPKGNIDSASVAGSYVGLLLLAAVFCAIGLLASSLVSSQVTAFVLAVSLCFLLYTGIGSFSLLPIWGSSATQIAELGIAFHYSSLARGVIDSRNVLYLLSLTLAALAGARLMLERRK